MTTIEYLREHAQFSSAPVRVDPVVLCAILDVVEAAKGVIGYIDPYSECGPDSEVAGEALAAALTQLEQL